MSPSALVLECIYPTRRQLWSRLLASLMAFSGNQGCGSRKSFFCCSRICCWWPLHIVNVTADCKLRGHRFGGFTLRRRWLQNTKVVVLPTTAGYLDVVGSHIVFERERGHPNLCSSVQEQPNKYMALHGKFSFETDNSREHLPVGTLIKSCVGWILPAFYRTSLKQNLMEVRRGEMVTIRPWNHVLCIKCNTSAK